MIYEDNILYVDLENLTHRMTIYNKTSKKIRLFLGKIMPDDFEVTVETIKLLPDEEQTRVRDYIRNMFLNGEI